MTSASRGTFSRISGSSVSRLAIISGSVAFFAPEIGMVPFSRAPPTMRIRSIFAPPLRPCRPAACSGGLWTPGGPAAKPIIVAQLASSFAARMRRKSGPGPSLALGPGLRFPARLVRRLFLAAAAHLRLAPAQILPEAPPPAARRGRLSGVGSYRLDPASWPRPSRSERVRASRAHCLAPPGGLWQFPPRSRRAFRPRAHYSAAVAQW